MSILGIVVVICLIIFALWLVRTYIQAPYQQPAIVLIVVLALIWIVWLLFPGLTTARVR